MSPQGLMILGACLVGAAVVLLLTGKTDAERNNPDRQMTPLRDQWPISMFYGRDWNFRSVTAFMCILVGFLLQIVALAMNS